MSKGLCTAFVSILTAFSAVQAQAQAELQNAQMMNGGLYIEGSVADYQATLIHDSGYRVDGDHLQSSFLVTPAAKTIFTANAGLRAKMPQAMPKVFAPIVLEIADYINKIGKAGGKNNETKNGLTNMQLAIKITRLAFCFGTDPYGIAAQIKKESTFDRTVISGTGAVGFTQMTGVAIDEVNDQFGSRGKDGTIMDNVPYIRQAANCYLGAGKRYLPMFEAGVISKGTSVTKNKVALARSKRWLRAHVDSDLIYGQVILKILLARARADGLRDKAAYSRAFKDYNGEPRGRDRRYANEVLSSMKTI
jgi:hypothetical protein